MNCREPTEELVRAACAKFDHENHTSEDALTELFGQYRSNNELRHVLLKVVAVNSLYATQIPVHSWTIPNVVDVARHIQERYKTIDHALVDGLPEIVDAIAEVTVSGKNSRNYFSFATKYCSWHKPKSYPIWDKNVENYFECLRKKTGSEEFNLKGHWKYRKLFEVLSYFRERYDLGSFTFKDIDKFLWSEGAPPEKTSVTTA